MAITLLTHYILSYINKTIFINILIYLIVFLILSSFDTIVYNMGNCIKTPVASPDMLDTQYYLTHHGIIAENRALNNVILELRQEIADLNNQIRLNNQLNIEHNNMIQQLTAEQSETKELIIKLKQEISQFKIQGKTTIIQESFYGCIK